MNSRSARNAERQLKIALETTTTAPTSPLPPARWACTPDGRGKFNLVDADGKTMLNAAGYPRTFSSQDLAERAAAD